MIRTDHLVKRYDGAPESVPPVLRDVSLAIEDGEFVAIMGRSGSGKSTLLYQLSMLDAPTEGTVYFRDVDTGQLSERERTALRLSYMGYVFQDYALLPSLTALENIVVLLIMRGVPRTAAVAQARQLLDEFGLAGREGALPSQLSGGEQQRVAIARAISHAPDVIFADEPTANLDTRTSQIVLDHFSRLHEQGQTIVMVTHEPDYAEIASRVVTLSDGMLVDDKSNGKVKKR